MNTRHYHIAFGFAVGVVAALVLLLCSANVAHADDITVCPPGAGVCDYYVVQAAVDAANEGDVIKVAAGVYTGTQGRPAPLGYPGPSVITQVVYLSKTLTIQGGYTLTNWLVPDPEIYTTTLDAQGDGRVMVVAGEISPTIAGLWMTGGDASGLRGEPSNGNAGGGVYIYMAMTTISHCVIYSNIADTTFSSLYSDYGGGLYLYYSPATLEGNTVQSNTASIYGDGYGGGLCLYYSLATLLTNTVQGNTATTDDYGYGGGLHLYYSPATLGRNTVQSNIASTGDVGEGGGLHLDHSDAILNNNTVIGNVASTAGDDWNWGGGLYLGDSDATLEGNIIMSNTASMSAPGWGGGLSLSQSNATFRSNTIQDNIGSTADWGEGGGLVLFDSDILFQNNTVRGNIASTDQGGVGGGLCLFESDVTLLGNLVQGNIASTVSWGEGGGVCFSGGAATLRDNKIISNIAPSVGGGLYVGSSSSFTLTNNLVAGNQANTQGSGLWFEGSTSYPISGDLFHNTIADNHGGGQGIYVGQYTILAFTNTIIAGHNAGITVTAGSTATLEATLWHNNGTDVGGDGAILTGTINVYDDPAFVDPATWDYHLSANSAAIDNGVDSSVTIDIDGDPRPIGPGYDLGADEFIVGFSLSKQAYLPIVQAGSLLTYTIWLTNNGLVTFTANITDVLPAQVTPGGPLTWTDITLAPDETWTDTIIVNVNVGYAGPLTNVVQAKTLQGVTGVYTEVSQSLVSPTLSIVKRAYPNPVQAGSPLTYTILLTNTGNVTLTATVTDVLPAHVAPGGALTWTMDVPPLGGTWLETLVVTVDVDYAGSLTNTVWVSTLQGAAGVYTETTMVLLVPPGVPTLLAPPDGYVTTTQAITLAWQAGAGAVVEGYNLDLDGGVITTANTLSATLLSIGVHTWMVRAYNDAGYSDWAQLWTVEVTETLPPPGTPTLLAPPNGAVTTTQAITLAWQAGAGAPAGGYNLDLDGNVITTANTLSATLLSIGVHTWMVRAYNDAGYSDWAQLWTVEVTETLPPPGTPTLLAPPNGAVTTTQSITLAWQAGAGAPAGGYNLDLDGNVITTANTLSVTLLSIGVHTWTVRAYNDAGYSDWAQSWTVQVTETLPPPSVPTLLTPPDGLVTTTQALTLAWQAGAGAPVEGYNLDLDDNVITMTNTLSATVLSIGVHTWTVRAYNDAGYSDWAQSWTVEITETLPPPGTPTLLAPPNGAVTTTQAITLAWQAGAGAPTGGYNLDLDGNVITTVNTLSLTMLSIGVHTWTVRAYNDAGYSDWATPWTLEIAEALPPPNVPTLLLPLDGAVTMTQSIVFEWTLDAGAPAVGYNLDVDGNIITTTATSSATTLAIGVHTWTVRAYNQAGYSEWAVPWTLEVVEVACAVYLPVILKQH